MEGNADDQRYQSAPLPFNSADIQCTHNSEQTTRFAEMASVLQAYRTEQGICHPSEVEASFDDIPKLGSVDITKDYSEVTASMTEHIEAILSCNDLWAESPESMHTRITQSHKMTLIDAAVTGITSELLCNNRPVIFSGRGLVNMITLLIAEALNEITESAKPMNDIDAQVKQARDYLRRDERRLPVLHEAYNRERKMSDELKARMNTLATPLQDDISPIGIVRTIRRTYDDLGGSHPQRIHSTYRTAILLANLRISDIYTQMESLVGMAPAPRSMPAKVTPEIVGKRKSEAE